MQCNLYYGELNALEKELEKLPPLHRLAFVASICERLVPNYNAFVKENGCGNPIILRIALDEAWKIIQGESANAEIIHRFIRDCEALPPDEDDDGEYMYEASMTCTAIRYLLLACLEPTVQNVAKIANLAANLLFETIVIKLEIANNLDWDNNKPLDEQLKDVSNYHFWTKEAAKQNSDFQKLKEVKTLNQNFIESFRTSCVNGGKSMIDLS